VFKKEKVYSNIFMLLLFSITLVLELAFNKKRVCTPA
jgi:hypothetical protein